MRRNTAARRRPTAAPEVTLSTRYRLTLVRDPAAEAFDPPPLGDAAAVVDYLWRTIFHDEPRELCVVLFVDGLNHGIGHMIATAGSRNHCPTDAHSILSAALLSLADGFILAHNHPRAAAKPSHGDLLFTRQLAAAARVLGLHLLDHLIVASPTRWCSLREKGHL